MRIGHIHNDVQQQAADGFRLWHGGLYSELEAVPCSAQNGVFM